MSKDDFADEILSDEQLDNVTGGTSFEYHILSKLLTPEPNDGLVISHKMTEDEVKNWLKTNLNIDATINAKVVFHNYGPSEDPNVYTQNGQTITHADVVKQCKAFLGID